LVSLRSSEAATASSSAGPRTADEAIPVIVELVGLPGTGKTTLVTALLADTGRQYRRLRLRGLVATVLLARNALLLLIPFLHQARRITHRRWTRFSMMVQLQTLHDLLAPSRLRAGEVILLDQGPVYLLSILQRALQTPTAPTGNSRRFERYWRATLANWSNRLDCVIHLEASDEVLHRRIVIRGTRHMVARLTREQGSVYFVRSRLAREAILTGLRSGGGGPAIVHLRTDRMSLHETLDRIRREIDTLPDVGGD
jgi:hypothetical protein